MISAGNTLVRENNIAEFNYFVEQGAITRDANRPHECCSEHRCP